MIVLEDTFLKSRVETSLVDDDWSKTMGRVDLTTDITKREHTATVNFVSAHPSSRYRLSTQPSIWNKIFLLQYLKPNLSPWDFETQDPKNDGWSVMGFNPAKVHHNEGVRRFDLYKLNLDGMCQEDIDYINKIAPWQTK